MIHRRLFCLHNDLMCRNCIKSKDPIWDQLNYVVTTTNQE